MFHHKNQIKDTKNTLLFHVVVVYLKQYAKNNPQERISTEYEKNYHIIRGFRTVCGIAFFLRQQSHV